MDYNFLTNISSCHVEIPSLLYYSHIPSLIVNILLSVLIIRTNRTLVSKILLGISACFALWIVCNFTVWLAVSSQILFFAWSFFGILTSLIFILLTYLTYVFLFKRDVPLWTKVVALLVVLPIIVLTPTIYSLPSFDGVLCLVNEQMLFNTYYYLVGGISFLAIIVLLVSKLRMTNDLNSKKEDVLFVIGVEFFILMFFFTGFLSSYIASLNTSFPYNSEFYGMFGMDIFMAFLAYLIVRFKSFNVKLLGAQALVWSLIILVGSQFLYQNQMPTSSLVLTAITLVLSAFVGTIIVRSVKKEVALRESLEIANRNQESLIHFVSHQLKGFFTKSKMIFAGIVEGDFGDSSETLKDAAKEGLLSDDNAVSMIQDILGASNLKKGTTTYNMKEIDFTQVVKKVCGNFLKEVEVKGLELKCNVPETPFKILADSTQIDQVVKNLIDNSLKYTPKGSVEVSLSSEKKDGKDKVLLVIKDTGIGLSESDKKKLFTEGGKGDESLKVNVNSTGYGLYIVKKIVENHGGKIWAESDGRGMGSRFYVELGRIA